MEEKKTDILQQRRRKKDKKRKKCALYGLSAIMLADLLDLLPFLLLKDPQGFKLLPCFHYLLFDWIVEPC